MNLFILAAGKGARLWPLTKNTPKSLIDLGDGTTLLERQISNAMGSELFSEIIIITGYKADQIDAKIRKYENQIKITTVYNPYYDVSNNLASLWTAHYRMHDDDFMITNGDNIYKNHVLEKLQADDDEAIQIAVDFKESFDEDDMKVKLDGNKNVRLISKDIDSKEVSAESVGLTLVKGERSRKLFASKIIQLMKQKAYLDKFWLEAFNSLVEDGVTIATREIRQEDWKEVDFHPDVAVIRKIVLEG